MLFTINVSFASTNYFRASQALIADFNNLVPRGHDTDVVGVGSIKVIMTT